MKRLLSVVAILILAGALLPVQSFADLRGAYAPLTGGAFVNGAEQGSFRPGRTYSSSAIGTAEARFALSTRSLIVGSETVRELWSYDNQQQAFLLWTSTPPAYPVNPRAALIIDPAATESYADPAWSPNGLWLAYVKTNKIGTTADIYVQQFELGGAFRTNPVASTVPVGFPILVVSGGSGITNRHPAWSPDGNSLVYDSNASGLSIDLYTVQVFPTVGTPNRITFNNSKAELTPDWSPNGAEITYASNKFGSFLIFTLSLASVPNPTDGDLADPNAAPVTHANPRWSWVAGDRVIYYDAPAGENPNAPTNIWRYDLNAHTKCETNIDARGDYGASVSRITNTTPEGIKFNYFLFSSTANNAGLNIWRGNSVYSCLPPLPMNGSFSPNGFNIGSNGNKLSLTMSFPPETQAAGYICNSLNLAGREGVRMRISILPSPTVEGIAAKLAPAQSGGSSGLPEFSDNDGNETINCSFDRRSIANKLVALGLTDQAVPLKIAAYSNRVGRQFQGFAYITVGTGSLTGSAVKLAQNSPNPFNPNTKISFAVNKPGDVEVRVFNVRGELVKTLAKQWFPQGEHTISWDGRTESGGSAPSGMYFAVAKMKDSTDRIKMMLMK